ncbi:hypothetical protein PSACC_02237 [Paramicrosporidium saccamoebae]|uniref:Uncharacterized protein n=1 Tax=Paramicrosporidium saccamoebae TaxID=1246581 RepID=A0A2H9TJJ6_9FUNG|nr:hypothetical protein PSACC_02237 [Paramicrosporidium saccamoebae]
MMATADFDFDLSSEDLKRIEQQETQFMTNHASHNIEQSYHAHSKLTELDRQVQEISKELETIKKEKVVKEGEVALLRQKLTHFESEKYELSKRHAEKLNSMEQERQSLLLHWKREIERLQTELKFKENEIRSVPTAVNAYQASVSRSFTSGFDELLSPQKRSRVIRSTRQETSCEVDDILTSVDTLRINGTSPRAVTLEMLFHAIGFADLTFGKLHTFRLINSE